MSAITSATPWLADLSVAKAWPPEAGADGELQRIDTHISHVFLTATRAYKIRRPVKLSFLDFSSAAERLADCLREVKLNRRLAGDVYLGLAPIFTDGGVVTVGPVAETPSIDLRVVEHAVVMRRLEAGRDLRSLIDAGKVQPSLIDRIATRLARFHAEHSLGLPAPFPAEQWLARTTGPARANYDALDAAPPSLAPPGEIHKARLLAVAFAEERLAAFEARRDSGRVVDGHGDLHAEHVWFEQDDSEPLMIDCLEFRDDFRCIDAASDVAFLAMDLAYRGRPELGALLLRRYARASGDYQMFAVVDYFLSFRALVRAKVASLVAVDESLAEAQRAQAAVSVRRHLDLGLEFLQPRPAGLLVLTCGTIGTGKTTVAEAFADETGGVVLSSDRIRRSARVDANRYSDAARDAVYDLLLEKAVPIVGSGRVAILDATYSRRRWRDAAAAWAVRHARGAVLLETVAPSDEVIARLTARQAAGNDASEAGPGLYDAMRAEFEEPDEWPDERRARVDTGSPDWREQIAEIAHRFA